jgi:hypothetical protein
VSKRGLHGRNGLIILSRNFRYVPYSSSKLTSQSDSQEVDKELAEARNKLAHPDSSESEDELEDELELSGSSKVLPESISRESESNLKRKRRKRKMHASGGGGEEFPGEDKEQDRAVLTRTRKKEKVETLPADQTS